MLVTIGQRADAEVCRGCNASGGMRIGAEQLLADGEDAGLYNDLAETRTHENAVDSDADPKLRLGVSLNVGGARR